MKLKALPSEWERVLGVSVLDPDGWDRKFDFQYDWNRPITLDDFLDKCDNSTVLHYTLSREQYRAKAQAAI